MRGCRTDAAREYRNDYRGTVMIRPQPTTRRATKRRRRRPRPSGRALVGRIIRHAVPFAIAVAVVATAAAQDLTLTDGDWTFNFDPTTFDPNDPNFDPTGGNASLSTPTLDTLYAVTPLIIDGTPGSAARSLSFLTAPLVTSASPSQGGIAWTADSGSVSVLADFELIGLATDAVSLVQNYEVTNLTNASVSGSLLMYYDVDFVLSEDSLETLLGGGLRVFNDLGEILLTGDAFDAAQAADYSLLIDDLTDGTLTDLDGSGLPYLADTLADPDLTFATQFDYALAAGESITINSTAGVFATAIPEPAPAALLGLVACAWTTRRRSRRVVGRRPHIVANAARRCR